MKKIDIGNISIGSEDIEKGCPILPPSEPCGCEQDNDGCKCGCGCDDPYDKGNSIDIGGGNNGCGCGCGDTASVFDPVDNSRDHSGPCEKSVYFRGCEDSKTCNMGNILMDYQGCTLDITMRLKNVCPGKRVAVGISLYEVDSCGVEYPRGMKMFTVPAHGGSCGADIPICDIRFILPEDTSVGSGEGCNSRRHFIVRVDAQYLDSSMPCSCAN